MRKSVARLAALPVGLLLGAVLAGSALAASGTAASAHSAGGVNSEGTLGSVKSAGVLPFTGLSLVLFVAGGVLLLAMGLGMRRLSHARD